MSDMASSKTVRAYKQFDLVAVPRDIPEIDVEAGTAGAINEIYEFDGGRMLLAEMSGNDGRTYAFVHMEVYDSTPDAEPTVVAYTPFQ